MKPENPDFKVIAFQDKPLSTPFQAKPFQVPSKMSLTIRKKPVVAPSLDTVLGVYQYINLKYSTSITESVKLYKQANEDRVDKEKGCHKWYSQLSQETIDNTNQYYALQLQIIDETLTLLERIVNLKIAGQILLAKQSIKKEREERSSMSYRGSTWGIPT